MSLSIFHARQPNDLINIKLKLNFIVRQSYPIIALGTNVTQKLIDVIDSKAHG